MAYSSLPDYYSDYVNVGGRYEAIFISGLILCVLNLAYAFVAIAYFMCPNRCMKTLMKLLFCSAGFLTLAWIIFASIVTFDDE